MNRNDKFNVFEFVHDLTNCLANSLYSAALILATMCRQQNTSKTMTTGDTCLGPFECKPQCVNPRVSCNKEAGGINTLGAQIRSGAHRWAEVPMRNPTRHDSIELLWERRS